MPNRKLLPKWKPAPGNALKLSGFATVNAMRRTRNEVRGRISRTSSDEARNLAPTIARKKSGKSVLRMISKLALDDLQPRITNPLQREKIIRSLGSFDKREVKKIHAVLFRRLGSQERFDFFMKRIQHYRELFSTNPVGPQRLKRLEEDLDFHIRHDYKRVVGKK